jgi:hypothetical protein
LRNELAVEEVFGAVEIRFAKLEVRFAFGD